MGTYSTAICSLNVFLVDWLAARQALKLHSVQCDSKSYSLNQFHSHSKFSLERPSLLFKYSLMFSSEAHSI